MAFRLCMLLCISAFSVSSEKKVEETFMKKTTKDLDTSASGYIYQQHGNKPAHVIYLNKGDVLDRLNEGEVLNHLNQGEVLGQLNQGEILPHLHLKMNTPVTSPHPHGYQSASVSNPGRSTTQSYYVTHYQNYGDGGKKYHMEHPGVAYFPSESKGSNDGYPHYKVVMPAHYHGLYNPLPVIHSRQTLKKTPGLGNYPTTVKVNGPDSLEEDEEEDDEDEDDHDDLHENAQSSVTHDGQRGDDDDSEGEEDSHENYHEQHHNIPALTYSHGEHDHGLVYGNGQDHDRESHAEVDGSEHEEEHYSQDGEKKSNGYRNLHEHDKGEKGHYDNADHSSHYDNSNGHKASGHDEGKAFSEHHAENKGEKGGEFEEKKAHKKGSKTTGYHNVFHKDEYKKVHTFYDDSDHKGKFKKYGSEHKEHDTQSGEFKKGAQYHSGHESAQDGKTGHTSKGYHDQADKGYNKKHGEEKYHQNEAEYAKKGGKQSERSHAYKGNDHD